MNTVNHKFICTDNKHAHKMIEFFDSVVDTAKIKTAVKNRKYLKRLTIDEFKKSCSIGDIMFIQYGDHPFWPMSVIKISDNRDRVYMEPLFIGREFAKYDYSLMDKEYMAKVTRLYPHGTSD